MCNPHSKGSVSPDVNAIDLPFSWNSAISPFVIAHQNGIIGGCRHEALAKTLLLLLESPKMFLQCVPEQSESGRSFHRLFFFFCILMHAAAYSNSFEALSFGPKLETGWKCFPLGKQLNRTNSPQVIVAAPGVVSVWRAAVCLQ